MPGSDAPIPLEFHRARLGGRVFARRAVRGRVNRSERIGVEEVIRKPARRDRLLREQEEADAVIPLQAHPFPRPIR